MTVPAVYNWKDNVVGDTYPAKRFFEITDSQGPVNLSNVSIRMHVRRDEVLVMEFSTENGKITVGGDINDEFQISAFVIDEIGDYVYSIEFTHPGDIVKTWVAGKILVIGDPTYD